MANRFTVFEFGSLVVDNPYDGIVFHKDHLTLLLQFFKEKNFPYYTLIPNGVRFKEYVGVLQIGSIFIEVLPKADKNSDKTYWREMLIDMIRASRFFDIHTPSSSSLKLKNNSILDVYFELFVQETELLLHRGLVKRYRKIEANTTALKGSIQFGQHIQKNLTHQERFFVRHAVYDNTHPFNCVLFKTLKVLKQINTQPQLASRIGSLLLNFPEMPEIKIDEAWFNKITFNRKTEAYKKGIEIAKLILLHYHPDVSRGRIDVLALMFDMNLLWEKFVFRSLRKHLSDGFSVVDQTRKYFWQRDSGSQVRMVPDIVIKKDNKEIVVLDTKWKNINNDNPSPEDLRQMYAYSKFHSNSRTALVYPGSANNFVKGHFMMEETHTKRSEAMCGILTLEVEKEVRSWQSNLNKYVTGKEVFDLK